MKLEEQVCSLDLAEKLKELGVKQDSFWYWVDQQTYLLDNPDGARWGLIGMPEYEQRNGFSAYTVAELGEMLPELATSEKVFKAYHKVKDKWTCSCQVESEDEYAYANTEANARAKMLIYLKEQNNKH